MFLAKLLHGFGAPARDWCGGSFSQFKQFRLIQVPVAVRFLVTV